MSDKIIELTFPTTQWYSVGDKNSFFQWLYSINGYLSCQGILRTLYVKFNIDKTDEDSLGELVALFERYPDSDIKQLRAIREGTLGLWFADPENDWHNKIFK